jgi:hypothetical protein
MLVEASGTQTLLSVIDHRNAEVRRWPPMAAHRHNGKPHRTAACLQRGADQAGP